MFMSKIQEYHREKLAYVYLRQSTIAQVRHHQESTERQYALQDRALVLGWQPQSIKVLDGDLGISGTQSSNREDFKTLVADVSMNKVGAVFALEASRLSRSCTDWHRLLEICALTKTLIIDEDGCYDPADFNDQLLLGLKGTMSHAELHFIRARLQGGKLNKAKKGVLRFPLPVGLSWGDEDAIILDPNEEVRGAVSMVFKLFAETGSAYAVVQHFARKNLSFPKRSYGGIWDGKIIWGKLTHSRVLGVLKNPSYAGMYVYGRYRHSKKISTEGVIQSKIVITPRESWQVSIPDHHHAYITWETFLHNKVILQRNQTNSQENLLPGPAREGLALLQGMLLCGVCGSRLSIRYKGNGGIYPTYQCNARKRDGSSTTACISLQAPLIDKAISSKILHALTPAQIELALNSLRELEERRQTSNRQWQMKIERLRYETTLAQRRYEEVDPSNRLVASTLESRWNEGLLKLEQAQREFESYQQKETPPVTQEQQQSIQALANNLPSLWKATSTSAKDRKRILRILIKDITVEKLPPHKQAILHIRWQGGACENLFVDLPPRACDKVRYPSPVVAQIRELAQSLTDSQIVTTFNQRHILSATGKPFTPSMIKWVRYKHHILAPTLRLPHELTVQQAATKFGVSSYVVYYWLEIGLLNARRINKGSPIWISINESQEAALTSRVSQSTKIQKLKNPSFQTLTVRGAE